MFHPRCILWYLFMGTILVIAQRLEDVTVAEGEAFVISINRKLKESARIMKSCWLEKEGQKFQQFHRQSSGEIIEKLRNNDCCHFKVKNLTAYSSGQWKLNAKWESDRGKRQTDDQTKLINVHVKSRFRECPYNSDEDCVLRNPETNETRNCTNEPVDWKLYQCEYFESGVMELQKIIKNQTLSYDRGPEPVTMSGPSFMEDNTGILECKLPKTPISSCTVEHFGTVHRRFNVEEGLTFMDYTAFQTQFQEGVCQFQLPSPTREVDAGLWKISMIDRTKNAGDTSHQCDFMLKSRYSTKVDRSPTEQLIIVKTTEKKATITCAKGLPYSLTRCYMPVPKESDVKFDENKFKSGICEFKVGPGQWQCGFNRESPNEPDILKHFEVRRYDNEAIEESANLTENSLSCRHIYENALRACIFMSPSGKIYSLPSERFHDYDQFQYHASGKQLKDGYCGIKFPSEKPLESGIWKCIIQLQNDNDFSADIIV